MKQISMYNDLLNASSNKVNVNNFLVKNKTEILRNIGDIYKDILSINKDDLLYLLIDFSIKSSTDKHNQITKKISQKLSLFEQEILLNKVEEKIKHEDTSEIKGINPAILKKFSYNLSVDILEYFGKNNVKKIDYLIKNNNNINPNYIDLILTSITRDKTRLDYLDFYLIIDFAFENNIVNDKKYTNKLNKLDLNNNFNIELKNYILDKISDKTILYNGIIVDNNNFKEITTENINDLFKKIKSFSELFNINLNSINYVIKKETEKLKKEMLLNKTTNPYLASLYNKVHSKIDKKLFFMTQVSSKISSELLKDENNNKYSSLSI